MKTLKAMLLTVAAVIGFAAFATEYTWKGGTGNWTDASKWETPASGYPSSADAEVKFSGDANITLDTGAQTDVAYINVTAGNVVLTATEGSSLKINWPGNGNPAGKPNWGITVTDGASLDFAAPLATIDGRFDRYGTGKLTFRDIALTKTGSANLYIYNGTNSFEGSSSVTLQASNSSLVIGVGQPYDKSFAFLKDNAQFTVGSFNLASGGTTVPNTKVVQDGAGTVVEASSQLKLDCNSANDAHLYTLKSGTLSANELSIAAANTYVSPNYAPEHLHYIQEGGTSTFAKVTLTRGSAALRGGVMNYTGADADFKFGIGTKFEMAGGTLTWPRAFKPSDFIHFSWSGTNCVTVPSASTVTWNWSFVDVAPGTVLKLGDGTLAFSYEAFTYGVGVELAEGKTALINSGATVLASPDTTDPWKVTLNNGSILKLADGSSRLFVPLDLTVNGTGKILFNGFRGAVVAHKLTVDGVEKAKGRYAASGNSFVDGLDVSSIFVPTVWTGNGGDNRWNNPANWDDGIVPNGSSAVADVSGATSITLDTDVALTALIANPNGTVRTVTLSGSGNLTLHAASEYDNGLFVPKGCELILDVNFKRGNNVVQALYGGGKVTFKKDVTICKNGGGIIWALDGTLALNGATISPYSGSSVFCNFWGHNGLNGEVLIEDGSVFTASRVWNSISGYTPVQGVRQTGGITSITADQFWLTCYYANSADKSAYRLEGGELTAKKIKLGATDPSSTKIHPGGSFEMSGGKLTCEGFSSYRNQNYVRLYGGDVYLKGSSEERDPSSTSSIASLNRNDHMFHLGGVTFHMPGWHRTISSGNIYLTGKNGNCKFDLSEYSLTIAATNVVAGPGGIEVLAGSSSSQNLTLNGTNTFTGSIIVNGGNVRLDAGELNGPTEFNVGTGGKIYVDGNETIVKSPDRIVLADSSCLVLASGKNLTVKSLVVGGESKSPGTSHTFGSATVTVAARPDSWLDGTAGDLSYEADNTTTTVDSETALSSLTYAPAISGQTNTLAGAALTFLDGANIHVENGDTLIINNDVVLGGKVTKTGWGEIVFNGGVTCSGTPAASNDTGWLTVTEGGATFDGAVTGVRLITCGAQDVMDVPVITLKEDCSVSNYAIVLTAWSEGNAVANVTGETHQEGATVDYSTGVFTGLTSNGLYPMARPNGGVGRYVLDSGTLRMSSTLHVSYFFAWDDAGAFELVQNGGTLIMPQGFYLVRNNKNVSNSYTLNGGSAEFSKALVSYSRTMGSVAFNGGTVKIAYSGIDFCPRESIALTVGGTVTLETPAGTSAVIANDGAGEVSFIKTGEGSLALDGAFDLTSLDVQGGTLTLTDRTLPLLDGTANLSIDKAAKLNLSYDGQATFKTLKVGDRNRAAGVYSATQGSNAVKRVLDGGGDLKILEGSDPGVVIKIR